MQHTIDGYSVDLALLPQATLFDLAAKGLSHALAEAASEAKRSAKTLQTSPPTEEELSSIRFARLSALFSGVPLSSKKALSQAKAEARASAAHEKALLALAKARLLESASAKGIRLPSGPHLRALTSLYLTKYRSVLEATLKESE